MEIGLKAGAPANRKKNRRVQVTETVSVLLPVAVPEPYSYRVPDGVSVSDGDFVVVPLGPRKVIGVVWPHETNAQLDLSKLRDIEEKFSSPSLPEEMIRFVNWVAAYTMTPPGQVLKMVLRVPDALDPPTPVYGAVWTGIEPDRMTSARSRVLETLRDGFARTKRELINEAGVSTSVIDALIKVEVLELVELARRKPNEPLTVRPEKRDLTKSQRAAADTLKDRVAEDAFSVALIDGVTGAGKTEVYFEAIAAILEAGRQALILLPEIALTTQFTEQFESRFGVLPALWHSDIKPKDRVAVWRGVLAGEVPVVVGARSALFLPFSNLGGIVVDEEHEAAFKQEDRVWYNARDMAVVRAQIADAPVILVSATPSIESRVNADSGRYTRVELPTRFGDRSMPETEVIDLRAEPPEKGDWISPVLEKAASETLEAGHQVLFFLNRRGYAPLTLCRACGHRFSCPNCASWLTEHRFRRKLLCHHCGFEGQRPSHCSECGTEDSLVACGPGVERLAENVSNLFPNKRLAVLSSDLTPTATAMRLQFEAIRRGDVDIIIATQLIAKGHNFPGLSLVGVIDADMGLGNGDLRATERTFQLISQVVGRAGRGEAHGRAFIQTHMPDHPVLRAIADGDRDGFYTRETEARRDAAMPPFSRLAALIISAKDRGDAFSYARLMAKHAPPSTDEFEVMGPAEAPLSLLRGRYRYRFLVRAARAHPLQATIASWLSASPRPRGSVRVAIDIDPYSFV
ncbi:MAG: primosomal protein N' [Pseudomonadota bacterium]